MGAPDMLGPDIVGIDMEGRDIGGPDTGGPGIRGTNDIDMGGRGIEAWLERTEGPEMRGLVIVPRAMETVHTGAADMAVWLDIWWIDIVGGPGMEGIVGPGGGLCWALMAFETSSSHRSASDGVRRCPLCICIATDGGGEWCGGSGCTQEELAKGMK